MKRKEDVNKKAVTNENLLKTSDNATHTYFVKVDYVPVTKHFRENSSWGVLESEVIFVETR